MSSRYGNAGLAKDSEVGAMKKKTAGTGGSHGGSCKFKAAGQEAENSMVMCMASQQLS